MKLTIYVRMQSKNERRPSSIVILTTAPARPFVVHKLLQQLGYIDDSCDDVQMCDLNAFAAKNKEVPKLQRRGG